MTRTGRARLAVCWTAGCGGCEATFLDLGSRLVELVQTWDPVLFPMLVDSSRTELEHCPDGSIDVALITGAIRTTEDVEMAQLLRRKALLVVAMGACAQMGSVLGLANLHTREELLATVYGTGPRPGGVPGTGSGPASSAVDLPELTPLVQPLDAVVTVDCVIPGCPPESQRLWEALGRLAQVCQGTAERPTAGAVLGALEVALCEECPRQTPEGPVDEFVRLHQVDPDPDRCLLDQGLVCSGPATRGGCGALCPRVGVGCRGCYGPLAGVEDQAARTVGALAALARLGDADVDEDELELGAGRLARSVVDPIGTLGRHSFARSLLGALGLAAREVQCDE